MKIVICQLCEQEVIETALLLHVQNKHGWVVKDQNLIPKSSQKEVQKNQETKIKRKKADTSKHNVFSYKWAIQQKLDKKYKPLISELALRQDEGSLEKEITHLVKKLTSEPDDILALKRLVLVSKAKQVQESKKASFESNKKARKNKLNNLNFERGFRKIKGISLCCFCKKKRLECSSCYTLSGASVLICPDCKFRHSTKHLSKVEIKTDALDHRVSGSFGSSRK